MKDAEPIRGLISRRAFLEYAGYCVVVAGAAGLWQLNYDAHRGETLRLMTEWEPKVAKLLSETIKSEKLDNLKVFSELARPEFVELVSRSEEALLSPVPEDNTEARFNLLAFALSEHWGQRISTHGEGGKVMYEEDALWFLNQTITRVGAQEIRDRRIENQANMLVEAVFRSYAAAWQLDPTMEDGVNLPANQFNSWLLLPPRERFVRLQSHS